MNDNVISGLLKEREALRARIRDHEEQASLGRQALRHMDATLRQLGYHDPLLMYQGPKRKLLPGTFYTGELPRMVMRALHTHPNGLTMRQIGEQVCKEKGWNADEPGLYPAISDRLSRVLGKKKTAGWVTRRDKPEGGVEGIWLVNLDWE